MGNRNHKKPSRMIRERAGIHELLKKLKKSSSMRGINRFLKKTLSFSDEKVAPKGYLAVFVGNGEEEGKKRFVIPTEYLSREDFRELLREAEDEFGFHQQGVLTIPCHVSLFRDIVESCTTDGVGCCSFQDYHPASTTVASLSTLGVTV